MDPDLSSALTHSHIVLLGSTGSIGCTTLDVVRHLKGKVKVLGLACLRNIDLLEKQVKEFHPEVVAVYDEKQAHLMALRHPHLEVLSGIEGVEAVAALSGASLCVCAMSGSIGINPTIKAIQSGKTIALANKEVLVAAGELVMKEASLHNIQILPVDSEHSALFQCLEGHNPKEVSRLILTASGGPFRQYSPLDLETITPELALKHPSWVMGPKNTIDSSTLMNKGLEVIEAHWLFNIPMDKIDVVIHPQSVVHSLVEWLDGSLFAQLSEPHMGLPIQYALTYPKRLKGILKPFDFKQFSKWEFFSPDYDRFRCLKLAYEAGSIGGSLPCYMNAANEALVSRFINREISWLDIGKKLELLMQRHHVVKHCSLALLHDVDQEARQEAYKA